MMFRPKGWLTGALLTIGLAFGNSACQAAMTLQFNITPLTQPNSGSLTQEADKTLRATNLAVTSISSVNDGSKIEVSKYLDFQSGGTGGEGEANFFVLDHLAQVAQGTTPTSFTSLTGAQHLIDNHNGSYIFTMRINYGFVDQATIDAFHGQADEMGWTGLLTLNIVKFDPFMASAQISSGTVVLTSASLPVPAGEELSPNAVPEPASCVMAGLGLLAVGGLRLRNRRLAA